MDLSPSRKRGGGKGVYGVGGHEGGMSTGYL